MTQPCFRFLPATSSGEGACAHALAAFRTLLMLCGEALMALHHERREQAAS